LTAGEIMQLPPSDELVLVSGCPPIRAHRVRYYRNKHLKQRILPPPQLSQPNEIQSAAIAAAPWQNLVAASLVKPTTDPANGGPRREPERPSHENIAPGTKEAVREFLAPEDCDDDGPPIVPAFDRQARDAVRQTPLDPSNRLGM
jgi:type IV secretion system protein VirD4